MARHRRSFSWGTLLAGLLLLGMLALLGTVLLRGHEALRQINAPPPDALDGPRPRWVGPDVAGRHVLHFSVPWRSLPQAQHGAHKSAPDEHDLRPSVTVRLDRHDAWVRGLGLLRDVSGNPTALERGLLAQLAEEDHGPFHLAAGARQSWAGVAGVLDIARQGLGDGERWTLGVFIPPRRGPAVWPVAFVPPPDAPAPILHLLGGRRVEVRIGEATFTFPLEPGLPAAVARRFRDVEPREWPGPVWDLADPWQSAPFINAANAVWRDVEPAIREAVRGEKSVTLSIDERAGPVSWGTVVAVLDILQASGVDTISFQPGGFTLRSDVPRTPDPLDAWSPPKPLPALWLLLASLGGVLLALAVHVASRTPTRPKT